MALLYAENGVLGYDYYYSIYTRVDRKIPNTTPAHLPFLFPPCLNSLQLLHFRHFPALSFSTLLAFPQNALIPYPFSTIFW